MTTQHHHNHNNKSKSHKKDPAEDWFKKDWKVVAAFIYLLINLFDFIIFPIMTMILPQFFKGMPYVPWVPHTTENGGLFHLAFGAILGVSAWKSPAFGAAWQGAAASDSAAKDEEQQSIIDVPVQPSPPPLPAPSLADPRDQVHDANMKNRYDPTVFAGPDNNTDWQ